MVNNAIPNLLITELIFDVKTVRNRLKFVQLIQGWC